MEVVVIGAFTTWEQDQTRATFHRGSTPSGILVEDVQVSSNTELVLSISIPADEPLGVQTLRIRTGSESVEGEFTVTKQPKIRLDPKNARQGEKDKVIQIEGSDTTFDTAFQLVDVAIPGVTATVVPHPSGDDDSHRAVEFDIGLDTPTGVYPGAVVIQSDYQTFALDFTIKKVEGREIQVQPETGTAGSFVTILITGKYTDFLNRVGSPDLVTIDPSDDIEVSVNAATITDLSMEVTLGIYNAATLGIREVVVNDGYGELRDGFNVEVDATPPSYIFDRNYAVPGDSLNTVARGTNTSFSDISPQTEVLVEPALSGLEVLINSVDTSAQTLDLTINVDSATSPQDFDVTFHTGLEYVTQTFTVLPKPTIDLDPPSGRQRSTETITITGTNTQFVSGSTDVVVPPNVGLNVVNFQVTGTNTATLVLEIEETATLGQHPIEVIDSLGLSAVADFEVLEGLPSVDLDPTGLPQGSHAETASAQSYFFTWGDVSQVQISVETDCLPYLEIGPPRINAQDPTGTIDFDVSVSWLAPIRQCVLTFVYPGMHVPAQGVLHILPGYENAVVDTIINGTLDGSEIYSVELTEGQVIRARVVRNPYTYIDPILSIHEPGFSLPEPLAENDDESSATVNSRIVYRAPYTGQFFLQVRDRFGFNTGPFELHLHSFTPEQQLEGTASNDNLGSAELLTARLIKGTFDVSGSDTVDYFEMGISPPPPGTEYLIQVIAQDWMPYPTAGADTWFEIFKNGQQVKASSEYAWWSPDPVAYVLASDFIRIAVYNEGPENTAYWLNVRPAVVINEVFHDEDLAWEASFVELHGEVGYDLSDCRLVGRAHDGLAPVTPDPFDIQLTERSIGPAGYHVIAHDTLVPGITEDATVPELVIDDPSSDYTTIAIVLECGGTVIDALCYRGNSLSECEGQKADDTGPTGQSIGRGYHIDTDRNNLDFIPQIEPSPWARNYSEVW